MSYLRYLFVYSGDQHILCCVFGLFSSSCVPYVASFLYIVLSNYPSVLSNVYINGGENRKAIKKGQSRDTDNIEHTRHKTTKNKTKSKQSKKQNTTQKTKMMSGPQQKPGLNPSAHEG
jgi:hypothetical protein